MQKVFYDNKTGEELSNKLRTELMFSTSTVLVIGSSIICQGVKYNIYNISIDSDYSTLRIWFDIDDYK